MAAIANIAFHPAGPDVSPCAIAHARPLGGTFTGGAFTHSPFTQVRGPVHSVPVSHLGFGSASPHARGGSSPGRWGCMSFSAVRITTVCIGAAVPPVARGLSYLLMAVVK